jgi:ElaB/YqjD/DUF883 family membrane-anchored ribosome-binding protein
MTTRDMRVTDAEATVMEETSHARMHGDKAYQELKARVDTLTSMVEERRSRVEEYALSKPMSALGIAFLIGATTGAILMTAIASCRE